MVYAYDQHMQMPVKDLYDTQIMAMAINAAKDMYEKGQKQLDDYIKNYGDFFSPIAKDMENYDKLVIDPYMQEIDRLYANGIDPIRSAEGRAAMARISRRAPIAQINQLKQSSAAAQKYLDNLAKLQATGKYNADFERFMNPTGLDQWDTLGGNGTWTLTSPYEFQTLKDATSDWFDKRTAHHLTAQQMKNAGYEYDPRYDYTGYLWDDLYETAGRMTPGWQASPIARFYRDQARKQLEDRGIEATPDAIEKQLQYNVAEANREYIIEPQRKADPYKEKAYESQLAYNNWKRQYDYALAHPKTSSSTGSGNNGKIPDSVYERNRNAMLGKISGVSGALMATLEGRQQASMQIKPYQVRFGQQFEEQYGAQIRSGLSSSIYTPWSGMRNSVNQDAYDMYKQNIAVPLGAEQFYAQLGIGPREDYAGQSSYRGLPMSDVVNNLISPEDFITNTTGMADGSETHTTANMRTSLPKDGYVVPQNWAMSPMQKDGRLHEGWWVDVYDGRGNKIGEAVYDTNVVSDFIRKSDGTPITNAGLTTTPVEYIARTAISSDSAPAATYRARNLDNAQHLTNMFDNSRTYFTGSPTVEFIEEE